MQIEYAFATLEFVNMIANCFCNSFFVIIATFVFISNHYYFISHKIDLEISLDKLLCIKSPPNLLAHKWMEIYESSFLV